MVISSSVIDSTHQLTVHSMPCIRVYCVLDHLSRRINQWSLDHWSDHTWKIGEHRLHTVGGDSEPTPAAAGSQEEEWQLPGSRWQVDVFGLGQINRDESSINRLSRFFTDTSPCSVHVLPSYPLACSQSRSSRCLSLRRRSHGLQAAG